MHSCHGIQLQRVARCTSHWTKHTMLRLYIISSISTGKLYFPTCLLTYYTAKRKHNYEVTTIIANCLLLTTTITLVCACMKEKSLCHQQTPFSACVPQPQAFKVIKYVDSMMHAYPYTCWICNTLSNSTSNPQNAAVVLNFQFQRESMQQSSPVQSSDCIHPQISLMLRTLCFYKTAGQVRISLKLYE